MTPLSPARVHMARSWRIAGRTIDLQRPVIVGIINVTPDSFSDGGVSYSPDAALERARELVEAGADVLDVGGESTRPRATPVSADEEIGRVIPVIRRIREFFPAAAISIDTVKAEVADAALGAGAAIVNDVSAFRLDPEMAKVCARASCGIVLMHSRGDVADMASYDHAKYGEDVTGEVCAELRARADAAIAAGIESERIVLDPGFGFSKTTGQSLRLLRELDRVAAIGFPVLVGLSRKRMIGELSGVTEATGRDAATVGANVAALARGARLFRVHDVRANRQALDVAAKINGGCEL